MILNQANHIRKSLILILIICTLNVNAQDFLITFEGAGAVKELSTVRVENLSKGTSLVLSGSDVLHLASNVTEGIDDSRLIAGMKIYPNPMIENSIINIIPPTAGEAFVTIYDISGRQLSQYQGYLDNAGQEFNLSGLGRGLYIVNVQGDNYKLSGKIICNKEFSSNIRLERISNNQTIDVKGLKNFNGTQGITDMYYSHGERLMLTAASGDYRTTITDIPDKTKTIVFDLLPVSDKDSNNYHVVEIGNQSWMAENLKTTRYRDGTSIPLVLDNNEWNNLGTPGYSWYNHSKETFKNPYGALYNGYTTGTGKLCPVGWHVPTIDEWISMSDYLALNDFGYKGDQGSIAKSIASRTGWEIPQPKMYQGNIIPVPDGVVGKDQNYNNSSGFNGFPAGMRNSGGAFSGIGYTSVWYGADGTSTSADFSISGETSNIQQGDDYRSAGFSVRCIKGETKTLANLITTRAYNITQTTASSGATIEGAGDEPITGCGVCWDTTGNSFPTIEDTKTSDGSGSSTFTSLMTGLIPGKVYYVRSYAITSDGIAYGTLDVFTTKIADSSSSTVKGMIRITTG